VRSPAYIDITFFPTKNRFESPHLDAALMLQMEGYPLVVRDFLAMELAKCLLKLWIVFFYLDISVKKNEQRLHIASEGYWLRPVGCSTTY
jgi:hypothetical protein